jgi:adenine specific DNA methylase Mod
MKTFIPLILASLVCSCAANEKKGESLYKKIKARITYYYPQKPYGKKVSDKKTKIAKKGITVAAHPDFKFGTKIIIPDLKGKIGDGQFSVQDRGSAVTKKRAAKGKGYVFDVFVDNKNEMSIMERRTSEWMDVFIVEN